MVALNLRLALTIFVCDVICLMKLFTLKMRENQTKSNSDQSDYSWVPGTNCLFSLSFKKKFLIWNPPPEKLIS